MCTNLTDLRCSGNLLTQLDVSALVKLRDVNCSSNQLFDLSSFVANAARGGIGTGAVIRAGGNPLSQYAITNQIPALWHYGVAVWGP